MRLRSIARLSMLVLLLGKFALHDALDFSFYTILNIIFKLE